MATVNHYTQEQRANIAARIGSLFDLPDAGMKIAREGWSLESFGDGALLSVELHGVISADEANKLINAVPIEEGTE